MAKPRSNGKGGNPPAPTFIPRDARPKLVEGLLALVVALLVFAAMFSFVPGQATNEVGAPANWTGQIGVMLTSLLLEYLGAAAWLAPLLLAWLSACYFLGYGGRLKSSKGIWALMLVIALPVVLSLLETEAHLYTKQARAQIELESLSVGADGQWYRPAPAGTEPVVFQSDIHWPYKSGYFRAGLGGYLGGFLYRGVMQGNIGAVGSGVVAGLLAAAALFLLLHDNLLALLRQRAGAQKEKKAKEPPPAPVKLPPPPGFGKKEAPQPVAAADIGKPSPAKPPPGFKVPEAEPAPKPLALGKSKAGAFVDDVEPPPEFDAPIDLPKPSKELSLGGGGEAAKPSKELKLNQRVSNASEGGSGVRIVAAEATRKAAAPLPERRGNFTFPPLRLLKEADQNKHDESAEDHQATAELIQRTLAEFGVRVTLGEVHTGPVITRYDVYPAAGVRVERIANLDRNLALNLRSTSVRVLAPVPGKGCVGIEVPNKKPQAVYIREILESEDWVNHKAEIPVALGREVSGKPLVADLTKMPHLLIAGSTGSGKTVCINSVVASLLYHASPDELRFVMVDPKIVEMQVYNALPHMLIPVVTDPKKVPAALKYLLNEMETRYHMFAKVGVRNIAGFNAKRAKDLASAQKQELEREAEELDRALTPEERAAVRGMETAGDVDESELPDKLPYVVVIIDELADLMMVAPADVETGVARLAQLARAAGIHLIIATQRPSVNVITGVIKANLPSRIAFKVASKVDSRTILDGNGADQLIGRGDMLFLPPGSSDLIRSQGAFVSDDEINGIVEFLKVNGPPRFDASFQRSLEESDEEGGEAEDDAQEDDMLPDAIEVLRATKRASTSMLQRRLRIGYNRAARIMEILEQKGIVGPENGAQPREILKDLETLML